MTEAIMLGDWNSSTEGCSSKSADVCGLRRGRLGFHCNLYIQQPPAGIVLLPWTQLVALGKSHSFHSCPAHLHQTAQKGGYFNIHLHGLRLHIFPCPGNSEEGRPAPNSCLEQDESSANSQGRDDLCAFVKYGHLYPK